jgi:nitroreductase
MFTELVTSSRSVRSFKPNSPVSEDTLRELIDVARKTPAAMNLQTLKYKLVTDKAEITDMLSITRWATNLKVKLPPKDHEPAAFIIICHDTRIAEERPIFMIDVGIAAQTILLAARERGIGGCLIGSAAGEVISETFKIEKHLAPKLVIGLGVPDEKIVLEDTSDGKTTYYRDEENVHHVPKRTLDEIIIK